MYSSQLLFHNKSLNKRPIFYQNIPKYGSIFAAESKFLKPNIHYLSYLQTIYLIRQWIIRQQLSSMQINFLKNSFLALNPHHASMRYLPILALGLNFKHFANFDVNSL